jgi:hypothetical protein
MFTKPFTKPLGDLFARVFYNFETSEYFYSHIFKILNKDLPEVTPEIELVTSNGQLFHTSANEQFVVGA